MNKKYHNHNVNELYEQISKTPFTAPTIEDITCAYNNLICLQNVTDTSDSDYHFYMYNLKKYIVNYNL